MRQRRRPQATTPSSPSSHPSPATASSSSTSAPAAPVPNTHSSPPAELRLRVLFPDHQQLKLRLPPSASLADLVASVCQVGRKASAPILGMHLRLTPHHPSTTYPGYTSQAPPAQAMLGKAAGDSHQRLCLATASGPLDLGTDAAGLTGTTLAAANIHDQDMLTATLLDPSSDSSQSSDVSFLIKTLHRNTFTPSHDVT